MNTKTKITKTGVKKKEMGLEEEEDGEISIIKRPLTQTSKINDMFDDDMHEGLFQDDDEVDEIQKQSQQKQKKKKKVRKTFKIMSCEKSDSSIDDYTKD